MIHCQTPLFVSWLGGLALVLNPGSPAVADERASYTDSFTFGVVTDCQYHPGPTQGARHYALSLSKLEGCVARLNAEEVDFAVHLGDFIDRDFANFDVVNRVFARLDMPRYQVLGNHDYAVTDEHKPDVPAKLGLPARYYDFVVKGWRFVVLDGNDISFSASPTDSPRYRQATEYYEQHHLRSPRWNGALGPTQLAWLERTLKAATREQQRVIVLCHFPIYPENPHNLWNAVEVRTLLERHPGVAAYLCGHNHAGNYAARSGIHYLTFKGMVDTEETAYAIVRVRPDQLEVTGFGREPDRILPLPAPTTPLPTESSDRH